MANSTQHHDLAARATIVIPLALMQIIAWGSIYLSFPLFIEPIHNELHWSRNAITGAMSVALLTSAGVQLVFGRIVERLGACLTMAAGALCAAAAMALAGSSGSLLSFYCAWVMLGVSMALCFFEPAFAALMECMPAKFEGNVSAMLLMSGATSAIFIPLAHALIEKTGWRNALFCFSAFNVAAALMAAYLARAARREHAQSSVTELANLDAVQVKKFSRKVLRSFRFWVLALAFAANMFAWTALGNQLPAILTSRGFSMKLTLATLGIIGPAQAAGRLMQLGLFRKVPYPIVAGAAFALFSAGATGLQLFATSDVGVILSMGAIGLGSGMITAVRATIAPALYDRRFYARLSGLIAAPGSLARAAAPIAASLVATSQAGNEGVLDMVSAMALLSLVMLVCALYGHRKACCQKPAP